MTIRKAKPGELDKIITLLHDDDFGSKRESLTDKDIENYQRAYQELLDSSYFDIQIMEDQNQLIGCYQIMYLPHISFMGTKRGQIESVRIRSDLRGQGLGTQLMKHAIQTAQEAGCGIFQLTSNKERIEANKFYRNLGLKPTHDGYKLYFDKMASF